MNSGVKEISAILATGILILILSALSPLVVSAAPSSSQAQDNTVQCAPPGEIKYYGDLILSYNKNTGVGIRCAIVLKILNYNNNTKTINVQVTVRPLSLEEYRLYLLQLYNNSYPIPPKNVNMTIEEYKQYLINKTIYNNTYMTMAYENYLETIRQFNLTEKCNFTRLYSLDKDNNVEGIGFFPLYSVFDPLPYRIKKLNPVYMGKRLVDVGVGSEGIDNIDTGLAVIIEFADGKSTRLFFKRNYLYLGHDIALPTSNGRVTRFDIVVPSNETAWFLDNCVPDYSWDEFKSPMESYIDYIVYALVAVLALVIVYAFKRWF